jgi:hypothetical protein
VAPGQYQVSFGPVSGYVSPANQSVEVQAGQTTSVTGTYSETIALSCQATPSTVEPGQTSTLTATASGGTGPYAYSWDTGDTGATIEVSPNKTTTYTVTVTDSASQEATAQATVTVRCQLSVSIEGPGTVEQTPAGKASFAPGESVTLRATPLAECDRFLGWAEGGQVTSSDSELVVVMDADRQITATFYDGTMTPGSCCAAGACEMSLMVVGLWLLGRSGRRRRVSTRC